MITQTPWKETECPTISFLTEWATAPVRSSVITPHPPPPPEPFTPPQVIAGAPKVDGTVLEQAHAAMLHARNEFQKHIDATNEDMRLYSPEGYRDQIARFVDTSAAKAVDAAVDSVRARRDQAAAHIDKVKRSLSPNGDTAAELRATRYWQRTIRQLDATDSGKLFNAANDLMRNATREELGTILQELGPYLQSRGSGAEWIDTALGEIVPEYAGARTQLSKANGALQFVETNAAILRRGFAEGHPPSTLADPFGDRLGNRGKYDPDK